MLCQCGFYFIFFGWTVEKSVADMMTLLNTSAYVCAFNFSDLLTFYLLHICCKYLFQSVACFWLFPFVSQMVTCHAVPTSWSRSCLTRNWLGRSTALLWTRTQASRAGRGLRASFGQIAVISVDSHSSHWHSMLYVARALSTSLYTLGHALIPTRFWLSSIMTSVPLECQVLVG